MEFNAEHAITILKRVFDCQDPSEQVVLISGKDKRRIPIHRVILNAASKYFKGLMGPNFQKKPKEFLLDYADGETIKSIVNFCYSGNIDLTEENVEKCLMVANRAEIELLEEKCRQFYAAKLSVGNSVSILMIADEYRFWDLRERALELICAKFDTIPSGDIQKLSHPLLKALLKCDQIREYGDLCAMRLVEWFQSAEEGRAVFMPALLKSICLRELTPEFLDDTLEAVFERFKCRNLINAEYKRRVLSQSTNVCSPCSRSIFHVYINGFFDEHCHYSAEVLVDKYNNQMKCFENTIKILLRYRSGSEVALYKNKIFVLGGYSDPYNIEISKSVSSYELSSGKEEVEPKMKVARANFKSIVLGKYIYVLGGNSSVAKNSCERFDTENNIWETVESMKDCSLSSAAVLNGKMYVVLTHMNNMSISFESYDPEIGEWTKLATPNKVGKYCALVELNGFVYAMEKYSGGLKERYDPCQNLWTEIRPIDPVVRINSSIITDGKIFTKNDKHEFGQVEIDGNGEFSFIPLCKTNYENSKYRDFLHCV